MQIYLYDTEKMLYSINRGAFGGKTEKIAVKYFNSVFHVHNYNHVYVLCLCMRNFRYEICISSFVVRIIFMYER